MRPDLHSNPVIPTGLLLRSVSSGSALAADHIISGRGQQNGTRQAVAIGWKSTCADENHQKEVDGDGNCNRFCMTHARVENNHACSDK